MCFIFSAAIFLCFIFFLKFFLNSLKEMRNTWNFLYFLQFSVSSFVYSTKYRKWKNMEKQKGLSSKSKSFFVRFDGSRRFCFNGRSLFEVLGIFFLFLFSFGVFLSVLPDEHNILFFVFVYIYF